VRGRLSASAALLAGTVAVLAGAAAAAPSASGPITITSGGTYSGEWISTTSEPAVRITTTEPVTIARSTVRSTSSGPLIRAHRGARVTMVNVTGIGRTGRFFAADDIQALTVRNCTIVRTSGIYLAGALSDARVSVTRNRQHNVQADPGTNTVFVQFNGITSARLEVAWNQVVNDFGRSGVEDVISVYESAFARIHDNYIEGGYPASPTSEYSGSGITIEHGSHDNEVYSNQVVDTTNAGIGIAGGRDNRIHSNRLVFDGRLDDGTRLAAANVGLYVWNSVGDPNWANNQAWNNASAWVSASGRRADWWIPHCSGNCRNARLRGVVDRKREQAEYRLWLEKLAAAKVKVGRRL
jgi:Right handed beta helix region